MNNFSDAPAGRLYKVLSLACLRLENKTIQIFISLYATFNQP